MEPELKYPSLHTEKLTAREREAVAAILAAREMVLYDRALNADDEAWRTLAAEYLAEQLPGEGVIASHLGMLNAVRRALGQAVLDLEDWAVRRKVTR